MSMSLPHGIINGCLREKIMCLKIQKDRIASGLPFVFLIVKTFLQVSIVFAIYCHSNDNEGKLRCSCSVLTFPDKSKQIGPKYVYWKEKLKTNKHPIKLMLFYFFYFWNSLFYFLLGGDS